MTWKTVRLELAGTPEFPNGSAARAYLLRLPLDTRGHVDEASLGRNPGYATVRRYWPNQPDLSGRLIRRPGGWTFSFAARGEGETHLRQTEPIRSGTCLIVTEANGATLPFRVHIASDQFG